MLTPDFRSGEACAPSTDASVPKRVLGPLVCQKGQRRRSLSRPWMGKAVVVFQSLSHVRLFVTLWIAARQATLSFAVSWSLLRFISVESVVLSNQLILCCPLLLLPSIFASIRVFSNESALHIRWPKDWSFSFSFSISPSNEYSGLSFRIDWSDLLAVQGTLKSLLQHHSSKASILWCSANITSIIHYSLSDPTASR